MIFNSLDFIVFLPIVFLCYWFLIKNNFQLQNAFVLLSSYIFYGWWDYRFLALIAMSTTVDYFIGQSIFNSNKESARKIYLWSSILFNLGLLAFLMEYNSI